MYPLARGILILDVVQIEKSLRLITPARSIFHVYPCINIGIGGRGELIESNSSFGKYCDFGDYRLYLLSANMIWKKTVYDL